MFEKPRTILLLNGIKDGNSAYGQAQTTSTRMGQNLEDRY